MLKGSGLQKLIDKCPKDAALAEHLEQEFKRINGIQLLIRSGRLRIDALKKKFDEEVAQINKEIDAQKARCLHECTTRHHCVEDGYTECNICGKHL